MFLTLILGSGCSLTSLDYLQADQTGAGGNAGGGRGGASASAGSGVMGGTRPTAGSPGGDAGSASGSGGDTSLAGQGGGGSEPEVPDCTDGQTTVDETDVDCGGRTCTPCADEKRCFAGTDCESAICTNQVCQPPSCTDLALNGDETDHNCGGSCSPCSQGGRCVVDADCEASSCTDGICTATTCVDGMLRNGCPLLVDNTAYTFSPRHAPTKCLDNTGLSVSDGTRLIMYSCSGWLNQTFWAVGQADGYFALRNALSGKCLQVRGLSTEVGAIIEQSGCDYGEGQLWKPSIVDSSSMKLVSKLSGLPLDVDGDEVTEDSQPVVQGARASTAADTHWSVSKGGNFDAYVSLSPNSDRSVSIRHADSTATLAVDDETSAHFRVMPGLSNSSWISFQSRKEPGRYLRHANFRIWADVNDGSTQFKRDATFRYVNPFVGSDAHAKAIESNNFPGYYLRKEGTFIALKGGPDTDERKSNATWWMGGR